MPAARRRYPVQAHARHRTASGAISQAPTRLQHHRSGHAAPGIKNGAARHGEDLIRQMLTLLLSPCRSAPSQAATASSTALLPVHLEGHHGLRRLDFLTSARTVLEGLFRAESPSWRGLLDSTEPPRPHRCHQGRGLPRKETCHQSTAECRRAPGAATLRGPAATAFCHRAGRVENGEPETLMKSLLQRKRGTACCGRYRPSAGDNRPAVGAGQAPSSEQPDTRTVNKPHGASQRFDAAAPPPIELRLMLNSLYSKVLNVYRATNRTRGSAPPHQSHPRQAAGTDVSQAHSLMDIEIKARNFAGALELYDLFFLPAMHVRGSLLNHGGTGLLATTRTAAQVARLSRAGASHASARS